LPRALCARESDPTSGTEWARASSPSLNGFLTFPASWATKHRGNGYRRQPTFPRFIRRSAATAPGSRCVLRFEPTTHEKRLLIQTRRRDSLRWRDRRPRQPEPRVASRRRHPGRNRARGRSYRISGPLRCAVLTRAPSTAANAPRPPTLFNDSLCFIQRPVPRVMLPIAIDDDLSLSASCQRCRRCHQQRIALAIEFSVRKSVGGICRARRARQLDPFFRDAQSASPAAVAKEEGAEARCVSSVAEHAAAKVSAAADRLPRPAV
jgi:hypothetical protein